MSDASELRDAVENAVAMLQHIIEQIDQHEKTLKQIKRNQQDIQSDLRALLSRPSPR